MAHENLHLPADAGAALETIREASAHRTVVVFKKRAMTSTLNPIYRLVMDYFVCYKHFDRYPCIHVYSPFLDKFELRAGCNVQMLRCRNKILSLKGKVTEAFKSS